MKPWSKILRLGGFVWIALGALVIITGIAGTWTKGGFAAVQSLLSPFNLIGWITIVATLGPGIAALIWAIKIEARIVRKEIEKPPPT